MDHNPQRWQHDAGYQPAHAGPAISGPQGAQYYPAVAPPAANDVSNPYTPPPCTGSSFGYAPQLQQHYIPTADPTESPGKGKPAAQLPTQTCHSAESQQYTVTGYITNGYLVSASPAPMQPAYMQPMAVQATPAVPGTYTQASYAETQACGCCSLGWVLFGLGFIFPICWVVACIMPFFTKNINDRRAAIASGVMIAVCTVVVVLAVAIPLGIFANASNVQYSLKNNDQ